MLKLYEDEKCIGEAKRIRFFDNAHVQRRFPGNRKKNAEDAKPVSPQLVAKEALPRNTISFANLAVEGRENV